jgi:hypothetical protein
MSARAPALDPPISPRGERRWHLLRPRPVLVFACIAAATWFAYDARPVDHTIEAKFRFTGAPASYVVPPHICWIRIEAVGAAGGGEGTAGAPGSGARAIARLDVAPGELLRVRVGGLGGAAVGASRGNGGWNGGGAGGVAADGAAGHRGKAGSGGGGATDVRIGGNGLEDRVVVAGGGSGGAGGGIGGPSGTGGGDGGAPTGGDGLAALGTANPATGGGGGTQAAGGSPGGNAPDLAIAATAGSLGVGGSGAAGGVSGGGGGGGGFFGGGGGGSEFEWASGYFGGGHGGGGSSFGPAGTTFQRGVGFGVGRAVISYDPATDACGTTTHGGSPG